jgi:nitrate/TMAO reductase-like tetraheme cytochrome c subunit
MGVSRLKNLKLLSAAGIVILIVLFSGLSCTSDRFTRISACTVCHEIFVDNEEYAPLGDVSLDLEDYKPTEKFEPGMFDVSVGCAECHAYPYEEYKESPHYDNDLDVRPGCVGCHEPHSVREFLHWKFFYINRGVLDESPFHAISRTLRDIPEWEEELRPKLAVRVREQMVADKSEACQVCHKPESEWWQDINSHKTMKEKGKSCIHCHYNLVHGEVAWPEMEGE